MPVALKRKGSPSLEEDADASKRRFAEVEVAPQTDATAVPPTAEPASESPAEASEPATETATEAPLPTDRAARFAALRARNQASRKENLKDTKSEAKRLSTDPSQLTALSRKKDIAQHKLLKADTEAAGEDFERKRAWDWTIDESERWDKRMAKKERARENVAFQDYSQEAGKIYKRQIGHMEKAGLEERKAQYEKQKNEAIDRAVQSGGLEIVETENGELIAVDKDGAFYSTADSTQFADSALDELGAMDWKAEEDFGFPTDDNSDLSIQERRLHDAAEGAPVRSPTRSQRAHMLQEFNDLRRHAYTQ